MKDLPLVSIALCTYNGSAHLAEQLDTLINQTYPNIEIVAVDDCSTDRTFIILQEYTARYPHIRLYRNETNLGFTANYEKALRLCTGEFVALCDQDDIWDVHKIELQVHAIKSNMLIYHDSEFIHEDGTAINRKMSDIRTFYRGGSPEPFLFDNCVSGHAILMKKELIEAALPFDRRFFHDWWLAYVAANLGTIDFLPECLVKYRQHDKSETNILKRERENDPNSLPPIEKYRFRSEWLKYCAEFEGNKDPELVKKLYEAYKKRADHFIIFSLGWLLLTHPDLLAISIKKGLRKLNVVRKEMRGIRIK
ncbi:MAG: glycosyltransferase family 2 protein [Bacteroidetes bacterium]|nr:glycosyltransferase family 2 protein [Bacteroidota bacterium]